MEVLLQFVYRLAFGLAVATIATPTKHVTSGYYRIHSYVLLGFGVLTALSAPTVEGYSIWPAVALAVLAYFSAVSWMYEKAGPGILMLAAAAVAAIVGAWQAAVPGAASGDDATWTWLLWRLAPVTAGLLLGFTVAAMLLGHWYLNSPGMQLAPLRRLVRFSVVAAGIRVVLAAAGLALVLQSAGTPESSTLLFLSLRWIAGLLSPLVLAYMTWKTLDIPNTQSATGILYVSVIVVFVGELSAQLLSTGSLYPL